MKTDAQVQQDVLAELTWEPSVNAAKIGVEVKDGIVTLAGHVTRPGEPQASGTSSTTSPSATDVRRPRIQGTFMETRDSRSTCSTRMARPNRPFSL